MAEAVDHPAHYGGGDNPYEAVKVIEAWRLPWHLGDAVKYIARAGKKDPAKEIEDLEKARWYVDRRIQFLKEQESMVFNPGPIMRDDSITSHGGGMTMRVDVPLSGVTRLLGEGFGDTVTTEGQR